ncbi:MAG: GNAT family N-acetyltransferase [Verrucomicrobiota bacterium]
MKLVQWVQFSWDLTKLPPLDCELPEHYEIAPASREDETELRKVISHSIVLDATWNPAMQEVMQTINAWLDEAFASPTSIFLALRHGLRIIGASILLPDPSRQNHLAPGPCVLVEYRNRGFGTRLLEHSLQALREAGVAEAVAASKEKTPGAKFLYPKFNGILKRGDHTPLLAA